ncbi:cytochrome P450 [Arthrobacter sp. Cr_A7]|uniref:cytochrome P450 n=1 Tax=Arthrobacter sp. Cr_A7 TaxID=3031017 RepID=UPI0023DAB0DA|nr:cytochrome P450 [Arthrobacter sp. Cr_A7]MDF2050917.1 cytochrome P450 [Arthrobacter sp. Cr_A7]
MTSLPRASARDTAGFLLDVFIPTAAKGPLLRRPRAEALAERLKLDERAVRRMQELDRKYPEGPLLLRLPVRNQAVILRPGHLHAVLTQSPDPFSPASSEKRGALAHFEPRNVLASTGAERTVRRALHEQALDTSSPVHRFADTLLPVVRDEADAMLAAAQAKGVLDWDVFSRCWQRAVRRIAFGDSARDDQELTRMLTRLRKDANWSVLKPRRTGVRDEFLRRVQERIDTAEPGSLASVMRSRPEPDAAAPQDQVPQWLFALETSGMAAIRALALLATHPNQALLVSEEIANDTTGGRHLPFLRATVLESVRLWPTTPMILRQTTREVSWDTGTMPAKCGVLIFVPFFHRNHQRLPQADRFDPALWLRDDDQEDWGVVPFSAGPVSCPGRQLTLLLTSALLSCLLKDTAFTFQDGHRLSPGRPMPGELNPYTLRFTPTVRAGV